MGRFHAGPQMKSYCPAITRQGHVTAAREGRMSMSSKWWTPPNHALDMTLLLRTSALTRVRCGADSGEHGSAKYIGQAGSKLEIQVCSSHSSSSIPARARTAASYHGALACRA